MTELKLAHRFDETRNRHYVGGKVAVRHCHHYATLYAQIAEDADELFQGVSHLVGAAQKVFHEVLATYFADNAVTGADARAAVIEEYWRAAGMGCLRITKKSEAGGEAEMTRSHLDEGWIKKWGKRDKPVNTIARGYLAGAFAALYDQPKESYAAAETQGIVSGAQKSVFVIAKA